MEQNRIIERIRKLLRLSNSTNPHEAALAAERVQRMLSDDDICICIVEMLLLDLLGKGVKPSRYI